MFSSGCKVGRRQEAGGRREEEGGYTGDNQVVRRLLVTGVCVAAAMSPVSRSRPARCSAVFSAALCQV